MRCSTICMGHRLCISSDEDEDEDINENSGDESGNSIRCHSKLCNFNASY